MINKMEKKEEKIPNCTELCKITENTSIILDNDSIAYPIKIITQYNLQDFVFSTYIPACIKREIQNLVKRHNNIYILGLEYLGKKINDIQVGLTGTYNKSLDSTNSRYSDHHRALTREVLEETGLMFDTRSVKLNFTKEKTKKGMRKWLCCSPNIATFTPLKKSDKHVLKELEHWSKESHKKYEDKSRKIGAVIWAKNCRKICEKLVNIDKTQELSKMLKKDNINSVCIIEVSNKTLPLILKTKNKSKITKPVISYFMVSLTGCPACVSAVETFNKNKLKYRKIGDEKGFINTTNSFIKNAIENFKKVQEKEKYDYYPQIIKVSQTGELIKWKKGERKGKFIGGNSELNSEL